MGFGPKTAGVMTFSQRARENSVLFSPTDGEPADLERPRTGIPIHINSPNRGLLAPSTYNETWGKSLMFKRVNVSFQQHCRWDTP